MAYTLLQIKDLVKSELDLEDEDFIDEDELTAFINQAIREAEAEIHKLGIEDKYFRDSTTLSLVNGTGDYSFPSDIYADKILNIYYDSSDKSYEIMRLKGTKAYADFHWLRRYGTSTTPYSYIISNDASSGRQIKLAPVSSETNTNATIWYIRQAKQLSSNSDVCDIPFIDFILQFVRDRCINKEKFTLDGPPSPALEQQRQLMIDTLTEQVPDGHNELEQDLSHYEESV
jgi:hypothetical protein